MGFFNNIGADLSRAEYNKIVYKKFVDKLYELHCNAYSKSSEILKHTYFQVLYYVDVNQARLSIRERFSDGDKFSKYYPYVEDKNIYMIGEDVCNKNYGNFPSDTEKDIKNEIKTALEHIFDGIADRDNQFIIQVRYRDVNGLEYIDAKPRIE